MLQTSPRARLSHGAQSGVPSSPFTHGMFWPSCVEHVEQRKHSLWKHVPSALTNSPLSGLSQDAQISPRRRLSQGKQRRSLFEPTAICWPPAVRSTEQSVQTQHVVWNVRVPTVSDAADGSTSRPHVPHFLLAPPFALAPPRVGGGLDVGGGGGGRDPELAPLPGGGAEGGRGDPAGGDGEALCVGGVGHAAELRLAVLSDRCGGIAPGGPRLGLGPWTPRRLLSLVGGIWPACVGGGAVPGGGGGRGGAGFCWRGAVPGGGGGGGLFLGISRYLARSPESLFFYLCSLTTLRGWERVFKSLLLVIRVVLGT